MSINMIFVISRVEGSSSTCKTWITFFLFAAAKSVASTVIVFWLRVCIGYVPQLGRDNLEYKSVMNPKY